MAPRIVLAGPHRGPLGVQPHRHHQRVSRAQPFVVDEASRERRRLHERRGPSPGRMLLYRVAAADR